ncbi:MAG: DUF2911 domain-containing protein [Gemmatimonadota bacterium]
MPLSALAVLLSLATPAQRTAQVSEHIAIVPLHGGDPLVIAAGDALPLRVDPYRCYGDVCERLPRAGAAMWSAVGVGIFVSPRGVVHAKQPGRFLVRARLGGRMATDSIRVLPPVKSLGWTAHPRRLFVGDTLRIATLALDSSNAVVGQLTLSEHSGSGGATEVVSYADNGSTVLYIARPGPIALVGRLAHRSDTLHLEAIARPDTLRGALIVRLGVDTLSVEQWTRTADRMEGDYVRRMPAASRWHYVVTVNADGLPRRMDLTPVRSTTASAPSGIRKLSVEWDADSLSIDVLRDTVVHRRRAAVNGMPIFPDSYAFFELWLSWLRRSGRDSGLVTVVAPLGGPIGSIPVRFRGGDSAEALVFGVPIKIRTDAESRLLGLDATASTIKHVGERVARIDLDAVYASFARHDSLTGPTGTFISTRDTVRAQIGGAQLWIDYGRPARRGRDVFARGVLGDTLWRTGANAATQFRTDRDLRIGGRTLPVGMYTLYTHVGPTGIELIFNSQTGQWGTEYHRDRDVMRVPVTVRRTPGSFTELFTIRLEPGGVTGGGTLILAWDDVEWRLQLLVP